MTKTIRALNAANKPVPPYTQQQYEAKLAEAEDIQKLIKTNEEAQVAVRARYEADKLRFRELTGKKPVESAPVVPPASPAPPAKKP